jgi:hypothetical protein
MPFLSPVPILPATLSAIRDGVGRLSEHNGRHQNTEGEVLPTEEEEMT